MSVDDGLLHLDLGALCHQASSAGNRDAAISGRKNMPKIDGFQSFETARRTIAGFEAML
ncbi:hypothetical protein ACC764_33260 [Rhizobium ruizarguesonis]|uniref:hypothetical protein n=1 Tax=Rhizobium ruizarguesonis TaxID=2081791 RepID=UPI0037C9D721